jgi:hypothetical protein
VLGLLAVIVGYIAVHDRVLAGAHRLARSVIVRLANGREYLGRRLRLRQPTLVVGCFDYEPLSRPCQGGGEAEAAGFEGPWPRLMQDVARILDVEVKLQAISASEFKDSAKVTADAVVGLFQTPYRNLHFDFSLPFHRIGLQGICRRPRAKISKEELASGNLKILVQAGEVGWEYVEDQLAHLRKVIKPVETATTFEIAHLLDSGRYDVAICDEISCLMFLRDKESRRRYQLAFDWPMSNYDGCIAVKKRLLWDRRKMDALNQAIKQARNTPEYLAYEREWIEPEFGSAIEKCYIGLG